MAVSGVRARRFIQPAPGGASAIFARQRGMVAPAPLKTQENQQVRSGKATGREYAEFLGKNEGVIKGAVNTLKDLLVGTFIAAKSLGATLKSVIKQIKGMSGGGGGGGIFKTLGMIGLVGAVIAGVAAIFGPQIKKAFNWLKGGADGIFQDFKGKLGDVDKKIEGFYDRISVFFNQSVIPTIEHFNQILPGLTAMAKSISDLPDNIKVKVWNRVPIDVPLGFLSGAKKASRKIYDVLKSVKPIATPEKLKPYRDTVDANGMPVKGLLGANGINFLANYDSLGSLGGAMATGAGNLAMGGIDSMTGFIGDMINNMLQSLGFTDTANEIMEYLGMGNKMFGEERELGTGQGISSLFPGGSWEGLGTEIQNLEQKIGGLFGGGGVGTPTSGTGVGTKEQRAMLGAISFAEGTTASYGTIYGGAVVPELERGELTIDEVLQMQSTGMLRGRNVGYKIDGNDSDATGKYQFMSYVLKEEAQKQGISGDTLFTPELQDQMILGRISGYRGVTAELLAKEGMSPNVIDKLSPEFASFSNLFGPGDKGRAPGEGRSYYSGQNVKSSQSIISAYNKSLGQQPSAPPPPPVVQPVSTSQGSTKTTAPRPPVKKVSTIIVPGSPQVAAAPQRPRPDTSVPNISGSNGNPNYAFFDPSFPDVFDFNSLGALA